MNARPDGGPGATGRARPGAGPGPLCRLRQRNRVLALVLAGVAALVLVAAVSVVLVLHYAEAHPLLSGR